MTLDEYTQRKLLHRQLSQLNRREEQALSPAKPSPLQTKTAPFLEKVSEKIPAIATQTMRKAFQKGFSLVFSKGTDLIGKLCKEEARLSRCRDLHATTPCKALSSWSITKLDLQIKSSAFANTAFSAAEGAALGVFGVGMPDVLILLSLIFKTLYEISLSYGFDYRGEGEQVFQLLVIAASVGEDEARRNACILAKAAGEALGRGALPEYPRQEAETLASDALCAAMLQGKLIQGIPLIGIYGGFQNGQILSSLSKMASIQYKRRFLLWN